MVGTHTIMERRGDTLLAGRRASRESERTNKSERERERKRWGKRKESESGVGHTRCLIHLAGAHMSKGKDKERGGVEDSVSTEIARGHIHLHLIFSPKDDIKHIFCK